MTEFKNGVPPEPGLYRVKYKDYDDDIYSLWSGRDWYELAYGSLSAELSAFRGVKSYHYKHMVPGTLPWKELHDG